MTAAAGTGFPAARTGALAVSLGMALAAACSAGPAAPPAAAARLTVRAPGVYAVTTADLRRADLGWPAADLSTLRLTHRGRPQPLWAMELGGRPAVAFYGRPPDGHHAPENAYLLWPHGGSPGDVAAPPPAADGERASPSSAPAGQDTYTARERFEVDALYVPQRVDGDPWLWVNLAAPGRWSTVVALDAVTTGPATLRAAVWAATEAAVKPDHRARLRVNGRLARDLSWSGAGSLVVTASLPPGALRDGDNEIELELPGLPGVPAERVALDWLEVAHPRRLQARADALRFEGSGGHMRLTGFGGPVTVLDVTRAGAERPVHVSAAGVLLGAAGHTYHAFGPRAPRPPHGIFAAALSPDLRRPTAGADYVVIGPADLLAAAAPLLAHRAAEGRQVLAVQVEAVFDQFGHGLREPHALRAFLRHAAANWHPAPRHVLLLGGATHDPRGHVSDAGRDLVPTMFVAVEQSGWTASDVELANVDDDPWPELAIGRIPAATAAQVTRAVDKALAYEAPAADGAWRRQVVAVADPAEPAAQALAGSFLAALASGLAAETLLPSPAGGSVPERLAAGALLVAYFGHGGIDRWGRDGLLTLEDLPRLRNGERLPLVLHMTCLSGLFAHPQRSSLAEGLLWQQGGGAVAAVAPTSLTFAHDQEFLSTALAGALTAWPPPTIGEALLQAWSAADPERPGQLDVMRTFHLLGDPALRLAVPPPASEP